MKSIALFVICLFITINGELSRLLLAKVKVSKCAAVNCGINPCIQCNPKNGKCQNVPGCCLSNDGCNGKKICVNRQCQNGPTEPCPMVSCVNPCQACPDPNSCTTEPTTDPSTGCTLCPRLVECGSTLCPAIKCRDPCINDDGSPRCPNLPDGETCASLPNTDPDTGCDLCPTFAGCPGPCGSSTCLKGSVCCNASCGVCTPPGGFCTQQVCSPLEPLSNP